MPGLFDFYARFSIEPSDYSENYYAQTRTVQELGLTLTHFFPGLTWVHGRINGAVVLEVAKGSLAEKAGLQIGDVIIRADKAPANGLMGFMGMIPDLLNKIHEDGKITLVVSRRGRQQTVQLAVSINP
jgi:S1-C subfamily serine protease